MASFVNDASKANLLIADCLNICFRFKHSRSTKFAEELVATLRSLAKSYDAGTIIAAADWKGSTYRKSIYPEYKANRKDLVDKQTEQEKKDAQAFFAEYERALELLDSTKGIELFRYQGVEADDIAAYIVSRLHDYGFNQAWLISSDRDWDLLVGPYVSRFSTVTRQEITLDTWIHPVPPKDYISYKVLVGDTGDNIPGIDGIGPKKAQALIEQYGSALDVYDACPIDSKYKYIQKLNEQRERIPLNYELMDLLTFCEEAIGRDNVNDIGRRLMYGV